MPAHVRAASLPPANDVVVAHPAWCDRLPLLDADALFAAAGRVVLVAPRPGDGLAAAGGLLAAAARHGLPVWAWVLTDDEPGHPRAGQARPWRTRLDAALDVLGVRSGGIERFRLPIDNLRAAPDALADRLRRLLQPGDVVLAPDATGADAAVARALAMAGSTTGCTRLGVLAADGHATPTGIDHRALRRFELDAGLLARKRAALQVSGGFRTTGAQAVAAGRPDVELLAAG
ncbi:hypothetical protein CO641_08140 [Lysobacteraceae bacterium NML91-0213]|nr:hypothetical protein CO641_08140 [Xanthomonadaceae bacterium NML91-0213]